MLPLAHLGIGLKLAKPFSRGLPKGFVFLGILAPDLLDKALFYGLPVLGVPVGSGHLIAGTRTFGHWGAPVVLAAGLGLLLRSRTAAAFALGMASHLLLDAFSWPTPEAVFWPFLGSFPTAPFTDLHGHWSLYQNKTTLALEALGLVLLLDEWVVRRLLLRRRRHF